MKFSYTPIAAATRGPHYQILVDFIFIIFIYFSYYLYRIQGGGVGCIEKEKFQVNNHHLFVAMHKLRTTSRLQKILFISLICT